MNWVAHIEQAVQEVRAVLQQLAQYEHYHDVIPAPRPPAGEQLLRRYEQYLGCQLPPSYRTFLSLYNGYEWLAFPGHMLAIEEVLPGGEYWPNIKEWKLVMAEAGFTDALDGIVVAYLDQPNNWVYLDPDTRAADQELTFVLQVPGSDPDYYPNVVEFLHSSAERARLALSWARQRAGEAG